MQTNKRTNKQTNKRTNKQANKQTNQASKNAKLSPTNSTGPCNVAQCPSRSFLPGSTFARWLPVTCCSVHLGYVDLVVLAFMMFYVFWWCRPVSFQRSFHDFLVRMAVCSSSRCLVYTMITRLTILGRPVARKSATNTRSCQTGQSAVNRFEKHWKKCETPCTIDVWIDYEGKLQPHMKITQNGPLRTTCNTKAKSCHWEITQDLCKTFCKKPKSSWSRTMKPFSSKKTHTNRLPTFFSFFLGCQKRRL